MATNPEEPTIMEPTDAVLDAVADALTESPTNASAIGRRARVTTADAHAALRWLVRRQMAVAVGNGSWTKFRTRRFGELPLFRAGSAR